MKSYLLFAWFGCVCLASVFAQSGEFFESIQFGFAECVRYEDDGSISVREYDTCLSFCCGGEIVRNSTNLECCGSSQFGRPYHPRYQHCCEWWTGHGRGHTKTQYNRYRISCCGTEEINWGVQSCCYGYPDPPTVFNHQTEKCCNAHRVRLTRGTPSWAVQCCGDNAAYDQRLSSCPCDNGQVINVPESRAACCETPERLKTPYIPETQICCNGDVGDKATNFCCGERGMGTIGDNVCCEGKLFPVVPRDINKTECCNGAAFDPTLQVCCEDTIYDIIEGADQCCAGTPYNPIKSICCQTNLWSTESQGTECCSSSAFFPGKGSFCCNGDVFLQSDVGGDACCGSGADIAFYFKGDNQFVCCEGSLNFISDGESCCGSLPYSEETEFCCDGVAFSKDLGTACCNGSPYFPGPGMICCDNGPFGNFKSPQCCGGEGFDVEGGTLCCGNRVYGKYRWPSCCVDVGYDASTHSCCGASIIPNPNESNQASCCGNTAYDRNTQLCCDGENVTIPSGIPLSRAQCCDFRVYDSRSQLCCHGFIREKTNRFNTQCCGIESYNTTEQICCEPEDGSEPVLSDFIFGNGNTGCCGGTLYNQTLHYCCDGYLEERVYEESACCAGIIYNRMEQICCQFQLQNIGIVPWRRAECCGSNCMYAGVQRCCNERIYQGNRLATNTCEDFRPRN